MRQIALIALACVALTGCKEEIADLPAPVEMTSEAVGFYCRMDLLNHEGPKGQIHLAGLPAPRFFSQVKDTIAYMHMPEQNFDVQVAYVQDMAGAHSWASPGAWMPLDEALFVIGSNQMGGMGAPEFVPFSDETAAKSFIAEHGGSLHRYADITALEALGTPKSDEPADTQSDIGDRLRAMSSEYGTN